MEYEEFLLKVVPVIEELKELCKDMTQREFEIYKKEALSEIEKRESPVGLCFMRSVLELMQRRIFNSVVIE